LQDLDEVSQDELLEAGASEEAKEKARALVLSFEQFIEENKDERAGALECGARILDRP